VGHEQERTAPTGYNFVEVIIGDIKIYLAIKKIIYQSWQLFMVNDFIMPKKHDFPCKLNLLGERDA